MITTNGPHGWWPHAETVHPHPTAPLHEVLGWILRQLNTGGFEFRSEDDGAGAHTLVLGQDASDYPSPEEAIAEARQRIRAVTLAGLLATARERGVQPKYEEFANSARHVVDENGRMNTDFHYAFQLVEILKTIRGRTFVFDAPPIEGRAAQHTLDLLQEATRCYLFGLYRACWAICRTALEDSLRQKVPETAIIEEGMQSRLGRKSGELQVLIDAAVRSKVLRHDLRDKAHEIRRKSNDVLHEPQQQVDDPWEILFSTRQIVEELHS